MKTYYENLNMNRTVKIGLGSGFIIIIILSLYLLPFSTKTDGYSTGIQTQRNSKDIWLKTDRESPFVITNTPFQGLNYYSPNEDFIIKTKFSKNNKADSVRLMTNQGEVQAYHIFGEASFTFKGKNCTLQLLYLAGGSLFIPFIDATASKTTYGAGRYLETSIPTGNSLTLDFNMAYNPYCAYIDSYSCPFPPKSNVLKINIEAGEKTYHQ